MTTTQIATPLYLLCKWLRNGGTKSEWLNCGNKVREGFSMYMARQPEWADKVSLQIGMQQTDVLERMIDIATAIHSERG